MKRTLTGRELITLILGLWSISFFAQQGTLQATVIDEFTGAGLPGVKISVEGTLREELTDSEGSLVIYLPPGEYILLFSSAGYLQKRVPVSIETGVIRELEDIPLQPDLLQEQQRSGIISLASHELDEEEGGFDNVSGLLQATKDVFLNAAAFDFSPTFFRPRGLGSEYAALFINGIPMNKFYNGRPQWSNWGGLNDVQRTQVFSLGLKPADISFGGIAGTTNIIMRAGAYSQGGKFSYAVSNRSYSGRIMGSYSSGLNYRGWAYTVSLSRRFAEETFIDGSIYDANSLFTAVEKKIDDRHSLNFSFFFTPNRRGKTSPNTREVYELKGNTYNSYWGFQEGEIRNSRIRDIQEPVVMLNHFWKISPKTDLNSNLGFQFGKVGNSRIDYGGSRLLSGDGGQETFIGGGSNPDPAYYQKLPSFHLRSVDNLNYQSAYLVQQEFLANGQIDWTGMYAANLNTTQAGGNSLYVLYEDRNDDKQVSANTIVRSQLNQHAVLNASVSFRSLRSENFARVLDLLGGEAYLDVDSFSTGTEAQNNLQNPNRLVGVGDRFKYHFLMDAKEVTGFLQTQFSFRRLEFFVGGNLSYREFRRTGLFQNGNFPNSSLGRSTSLDFSDYGGKTGMTYKLSGRHVLDLNAAYFTKAPGLQNSFSNSRQNNEVVNGLTSEKILAVDAGYVFRTPMVKSRLTGYYINMRDATELSFYFADGISGLGRNNTTAFVQEVLTDVGKLHLGVEMGLEVQVLPSVKLKGVAAMGRYTYDNDPVLYLTSDDFEEELHYGAAYIKNYRIAGGPQRAYQVGFEYRDPNFWWFSTTANFFSHAYVDIAPLTRTRNFFTDSDGLPITGYDEKVARALLKQERFESYMLINAIGGKSWRLKRNFVGVFASINNILNANHRTGGYEQSRNANYTSLKADKQREKPLFDPKYWFGFGTTYYSHIYLRF